MGIGACIFVSGFVVSALFFVITMLAGKGSTHDTLDLLLQIRVHVFDLVVMVGGIGIKYFFGS